MNSDDLCRNCKHFFTMDEGEDAGACRRYPPVALVDKEGEEVTTFPLVADSWLCGEFARRVN